MSTRRNRNRRANRKSRRNRRNRRMNGGYAVNNASPMELTDNSMLNPQALSLSQGNQFGALTKNMHGGMGTYPSSVLSSSLPQNLQASARLLDLNDKYAAIAGMKDQAGGRRRRKSRKGRKASRKNRKSRRKSMRGGANPLGYASTDSPGMLLDAAATARAGLNPEWQLAENPNSFAPKH